MAIRKGRLLCTVWMGMRRERERERRKRRTELLLVVMVVVLLLLCLLLLVLEHSEVGEEIAEFLGGFWGITGLLEVSYTLVGVK